MDGVIYHGNMLLPGVTEFVDWLKTEKHKAFLFLTNSSERAPQGSCSRSWHVWGWTVDESHFYTSALSTAAFLQVNSARGAACMLSASRVWSARCMTRALP